MKKGLETIPGFNSKKVFELIDIRGFKYIDMESIGLFMTMFYNNFVANSPKFGPSSFEKPKFLKAVMRRLGFDTTQRIDFREFSGIIKPFCTI